MAAIRNKTQEKVLEIKDLRVSFKTDSGTVKAVRGISLELYRGRTLAIVGESGSGKSVTSKAILGILANNKIIEDGEIIYDGKDLLTLSEEQFTKLRGVKLSMIFQDPLSSLNPIMMVGKQLTEAITLKHKAEVRDAKRYLRKIEPSLKEADSLLYSDLLSALNARFNPEKAGESDKDKVLKEFKIEDYFDLFDRAYVMGYERQCQSISLFLPRLKEVYAQLLENFSIENAYKEMRKISREIEACELKILPSRDNVIAVFIVALKKYLKSSKEASKLRNKLDKEFLKYRVSSFYDLPAEVRAKAREVILSEDAYILKTKKLIEGLIAHLEEILAYDLATKRQHASSMMKAFIDAQESLHKTLNNEEARHIALKMMEEVGIDEPERRFRQYPFELSGGMRQRIVIAIALCSSPEVLICDEPTTALDVTIQAQILELINELKEKKNLSIVFITHDLGVVANMADDIAVMYAGKVVEEGSANDIFYDPRHPYTWALLGSVPDLNTKEKLDAIPGTPPNMLLPPKGDAFASRNKNALAIDFEMDPPFFEVSPTHRVASWSVHEKADELEAPEIVINRIKDALLEHPESRPNPTNTKNSILNHIEKGGKTNGKKKKAA